MEEIYSIIDADGDSQISPNELYDYTFDLFNVLCREPGYKAYYYRYLGGTSAYTFYGDSDTLLTAMLQLTSPTSGRRRL
jgi:hypothetical protein